jgi:hypothetical protein
MITRLILVVAVVAALGRLNSFAQPPGAPDAKDKKDEKTEPPKPEPPKAGPTRAPAKDEPPVFEIRMEDDTVLKVSLLEPTLTVVTKYGKLSVPVTDVRRLEFGFRFPDGMEAKVEKAIADLGSPEFRTREDAEQALADLGLHAVPALRRATRSDDPEVVRRAQAVLKVLTGKLTPEQLELRDYDTVETPEFVIKGKLDVSTMKVRSKYFGETTLKVADIRSFRGASGSARGEFALDSAKYAKVTQSEWMETGVELSSGQQLEITASGKIDPWPQSPGQYGCDPAGLAVYAGQPLPDGVMRIGTPGQVVARIGPKGTPFVVGASFKGKVTESGKLYLCISPSPWNCDSSGNYKVVVSATY